MSQSFFYVVDWYYMPHEIFVKTLSRNEIIDKVYEKSIQRGSLVMQQLYVLCIYGSTARSENSNNEMFSLSFDGNFRTHHIVLLVLFSIVFGRKNSAMDFHKGLSLLSEPVFSSHISVILFFFLLFFNLII